MRIKGFRKQLYLLTYDRREMDQKALKMKRSFDEVKKILNPSQGKEKPDH